MKRKLSIAVCGILLIAGFTFSFLSDSLLKLPKTSLNAQPALPTMTFFRATLPAIADHIADAQSIGYPNVLSRLRNERRRKRNRRIACRNFVPQPPINTSCDEYPFASSYEGGAGASIRGVPLWQQKVQGGIISIFYRVNNIEDGNLYRVEVN